MIKKLLILLLLLTFATSCYAAQYVNGYHTNNGTYVPGYYRSNADFTKTNNYSTSGNINPYTGQRGYSSPYQTLPTNNTYRPYKSRIAMPNY